LIQPLLHHVVVIANHMHNGYNILSQRIIASNLLALMDVSLGDQKKGTEKQDFTNDSGIANSTVTVNLLSLK
jgi:hypothetical protein